MTWTSEPWPEGVEHPGAHSDELGRRVCLWAYDYDRARACVNALAGRDPSKLKELEAAIEAQLAWRAGAYVVDGLDEALAAFRQQKGRA